MSDDFFAMLEAEIASAKSKAQLKSERDLAKKRANSPGLSTAARQRAAAEYKEISEILAAEEWRAETTSALFAEQSCDGCGSVHRVFLQFMETQVQISRPSTRRWVRVSAPRSDLPRDVMVQKSITHICPDCASDHGFISETQVLVRDETLSPSTTYIQEDINAPAN